jgi:cytochrome c553
MKFFFRILVSILALQSLHAFAAGDAATGQGKAAICAACHGADGNSAVPNWPKLAGQHENYLVRQSVLIKSGARSVPEMAGIIAMVSEEDMGHIAAWYSSQQIKGGVADKALAETGQSIWRAGNTETGVPACMACHGPAGEGNPLSGYPSLAGQHSVYTAAMLKKFRSGDHWGEKDASSEVMNGVAARMTDDEIAAVASFIEGLYLQEK